MKNFCWILMLAGLTLLGFSCKGKTGSRQAAPAIVVLQRGVIMQKISCLSGDCSFALYLPSQYDSTKKWPVIVAFDPSGKGSIPLKLCQEQAQKYGYILIGSNDSRNGLPFQTSLEIFKTLIQDVSSRLSIDPDRIQLFGFSGGARVAGAIAMTRSDIHAVIGCSARLPDLGAPITKPFEYLGVAGMGDMNYLEMKLMFNQLDKSPLPHFLLLHDGKHAWPPATMIPEIFYWLQLKAMKDGFLPTDNDYIAEVLTAFHRDLVVARQANDLLLEEYVCHKAIHYLEGFPQDVTFKKELDVIQKRPAYQGAVNQCNKILQHEKDAQLDYAADLMSKDVNWWRKEAASLDKKTKTSATSDEKMMYKRVLGYLSLATYTSVNQAMRSGAWDAADRYNQLYAVIDPENAEHAYLGAVLFLKQGKESEAIKSLQDAVNLGFNDLDRMEKDSSFASLREKAAYVELLGKMKK
ncbi:MAG: hypothetical protein WCO63_09035 [Bacteroidota bacterium]